MNFDLYLFLLILTDKMAEIPGGILATTVSMPNKNKIWEKSPIKVRIVDALLKASLGTRELIRDLADQVQHPW